MIGEAAYLISKEFKSKNASVERNDIMGMRRILVHVYYQIKNEIICATIATDLISLKSKLQKLIIKYNGLRKSVICNCRVALLLRLAHLAS